MGQALRAACGASAGLGLSPAANDARGVIDGLIAHLPSAKGKQAECGAPGQGTKDGGRGLRPCDWGEPRRQSVLLDAIAGPVCFQRRFQSEGWQKGLDQFLVAMDKDLRCQRLNRASDESLPSLLALSEAEPVSKR